MLIKICGVKDPDIAAFASQNGAHFIGLIMSPGFSRSVTLRQAQAIVQATKEGGGEPVAVFVKASTNEIESTCDQLGIQFVQAYDSTLPLIDHLNYLYVNDPRAILRPGKDFLLMESHRPGKGEKIDRVHFSPPCQRPWLIAGGLTPENVKDVILQTRPDGVDVSSGVEEKGMKSPLLILNFIKQVKDAESAQC